jgi:hypothetical protein
MKRLVFTSKVVVWPGDAAWYFAYLDDKQSKKLRERPTKKRRGFGAVKVRAKIGKTTFDTSLFPMKEGPYVLPLKKSVRFAEGIDAGDVVKVSCVLL